MEDFVDTYTPEGNMRSYGDWKNAVKTNINQVRMSIINDSSIQNIRMFSYGKENCIHR